MLVANWKEVLKRSAVVWVGLAGALLPEVPGLILKWLDSSQSEILTPEAKNWLRAILLGLVIPLVRIWQQKGLTTATERKLEEEKLTRLALEKEATTDGPPLSAMEVQDIKHESAEAVKG